MTKFPKWSVGTTPPTLVHSGPETEAIAVAAFLKPAEAARAVLAHNHHDELLASLRAVLPYAESRAEDMVETAEEAENRAKLSPNSRPIGSGKGIAAIAVEAREHANKAVAAVDAAKALLASLPASSAEPEPQPVDFETRPDGGKIAFIPISSAARQWSIDTPLQNTTWEHERFYASRAQAKSVRREIEAEGFTVREV